MVAAGPAVDAALEQRMVDIIDRRLAGLRIGSSSGPLAVVTTDAQCWVQNYQRVSISVACPWAPADRSDFFNFESLKGDRKRAETRGEDSVQSIWYAEGERWNVAYGGLWPLGLRMHAAASVVQHSSSPCHFFRPDVCCARPDLQLSSFSLWRLGELKGRRKKAELAWTALVLSPAPGSVAACLLP